LKILALDTATEGCSAALWIDERVCEREVEAERGHAELILTMIDDLLTEAALPLGSLDAIAFGRGPGAFTGVRLAASVTQGLAFGAGLPVVPISDLRAVAQRAFGLTVAAAPHRVVVCNDARMHEVYWGCFELGDARLMRPAGPEHVGPPVQVELPPGWRGTDVLGAGRGFGAYPMLPERLGAVLYDIVTDVLPSAGAIARLAADEVRRGQVLPAEQALPVYLRDDVARPRPP
jgi:tRNA threonylcarbamoyladenosine biosynthesis protein TsaB